jgi:fatty acid desaturase
MSSPRPDGGSVTASAADVRPKISPEAMHALAAPRFAKTLVALTIDWAIIALAVGLSRWLANPLAYVVAVLVIAGRQHSLLIFMHDAAHGTLARNKLANETVGQVACAWPLLLDVRSFRYVHLKHHRLEGAPGDPDFDFRSGDDWRFPRSLASVARPIVLDFFGFGAVTVLSYLKYYGQAPRDTRSGIALAKGAFYAIAIAVVARTGAWTGLLAYWVVPMLTALKAFVRWREIAEHYGVKATHALDRTRTTLATWIERVTIAPRNINFHIEHHLFPGVPWHSLPALHATLMRIPDYAARAHVTKGYLAALEECSLEAVAVPEASQPADAE